MEKTLSDLSASTLRRLLIEDVRKFINALDNGSTEELEEIKRRLREIFRLLEEKERHEIPLAWGKNSKKTPERLKGAPLSKATDIAPTSADTASSTMDIAPSTMDTAPSTTGTAPPITCTAPPAS